MKVAFFGTSDRSIPILESLKENFELVFCVTKDDVKYGRHQKIKETQVKTWAKKNDVTVFQLSSLKGDDLDNLLKVLKRLGVEYGIVADFSFIIPYGIIEYFHNKLINIHFSLLPKYRGASPVQFSLLNGDSITGITFHLIDAGLDNGGIIKQYEYNIPTNISSGNLYHILFKYAAENLSEVLKQFSAGESLATLQDHAKATFTYSPSHPKSTFIYKADALINWKNSAETVNRQIHAYNPWPISWCLLKDLEGIALSTGKVSLRPQIDQNLRVKIFDSEVILGKLNIKSIQVEGKKETNFESFKNGYFAAIEV